MAINVKKTPLEKAVLKCVDRRMERTCFTVSRLLPGLNIRGVDPVFGAFAMLIVPSIADLAALNEIRSLFDAADALAAEPPFVRGLATAADLIGEGVAEAYAADRTWSLKLHLIARKDIL